ncbi:hypothetical protein GJR96_17640 [Haloferax sp. MBLA0076]|uniref:Lipoprotein n=1 Tax=Haloferax litoreum TaxID=2666140 RepID=A0A6A8GKD8_9EURY|nr:MULTISPECIES: hypothetical protein [Haloferax]KAB1189995.1 hypothetical protein Hfx1148_17575 [Haloferax sp. CBA1148]MRX23768.1 hypothetical protein [Haloferax litoreum]
MSPRTRRRFLHGCGAALLIGLAGCTGSDSSTRGSPTAHGPRREDLVTDYDYLELRHESPEAIFGDADREDESALPSFLLGSEDELRDVEFTAIPDGIEDARRFIDSTNFDEQALVIIQHRTDACHGVDLLYVASPPDHSVDVDFCRTLRDADVECSTDERHVLASLIRLPYALSDRSEHGWSHGGGTSCRLPPSLRTETMDEEDA